MPQYNNFWVNFCFLKVLLYICKIKQFIACSDINLLNKSVHPNENLYFFCLLCCSIISMKPSHVLNYRFSMIHYIIYVCIHPYTQTHICIYTIYTHIEQSRNIYRQTSWILMKIFTVIIFLILYLLFFKFKKKNNKY